MNEYIIIGLAILVIAIITFLLIKFNGTFRRNAYKLFLYAEHNVITGRKMDYVVNEIYNMLPAIFRILPQSFYRSLLQKMFDEIKDLLDDGKINKSSEVE